MTMAEVMIAAVLLGFVIMSSLTALSQAYAFTRHARMVTLASQVIQSVMEDLRLRNFNEIKTYAAQTQPVSFASTLASERFQSTFTTSFNLTGEFTTLVASSSGQLGKISVRAGQSISFPNVNGTNFRTEHTAAQYSSPRALSSRETSAARILMG